MGYASTVPAAIAGLVAILAGWPDLAGVDVIDGPPTEDSGVMEGIAIGYSPDEDVDAVEAQATGADLGGATDRESYTIHCSLTVIDPDRDLVVARSRAYELFAAVGAALVSDRSLRGAVAKARLGDHALRQGDTDGGMLARVNFSVSVDAFTGR